MKIMVAALTTLALVGCGSERENDKPRYGNSGLPTNCRALIQANIDGVIAGTYTAYEALGSIDRNCSANGPLWP